MAARGSDGSACPGPGSRAGTALNRPLLTRFKFSAPHPYENVYSPFISEGTNTRSIPAPSPELVFHTILAFQHSAALRAGIDLDLFSAIGEGHATVAQIADRCSASERGIRSLCDYLTVIGFLSKLDGHYANTPTSAAFLDRRSPACIGSVARFLHDPRMMSPWQNLTEIVRAATTTLPGDGSVDPENPVWVEFAHGMAPMMAPVARYLIAYPHDAHNRVIKRTRTQAGPRTTPAVASERVSTAELARIESGGRRAWGLRSALDSSSSESAMEAL